MAQLEIIIKDVAQYIFKHRDLTLVDGVYDKLLEEIISMLREKSLDLAIDEMTRRPIKFDDNSDKSEFTLELQQKMYGELVRNLRRAI